MSKLSIDLLKDIGRDAARDVVGAPVEEIEVTIGEDSTHQPAYYFWYRINQDQDRKRASLLRTRLTQKLRDTLIAQDDAHYPIIRMLSRDDWENGSMIDPDEMVAAARVLATPQPISTAPLSDGRIGRAISTAYYALFHAVVGRGAERFMGAGNGAEPGYALLYRGFNHGRMKTVCKSIDVATLNDRLQFQLRTTAVSQDMRDFASTFVSLQERRHRADYDPHAQFFQRDAFDAVDDAETALRALGNVASNEQTDIFALMLMPGRD